MRILVSFALALAFAQCACAGSTVDPTNRWAYGAALGWVDFRADGTNGVSIGETVCSGYAYSANAGWIFFGSGAPADGIRYGNAAAGDCGVNHDGAGNLRGFAWGANVGWIRFEDTGAPRVSLQTGSLQGYAWGANVGWIGLSNLHAHVRTTAFRSGADSNSDGIPDSWELEQGTAIGQLLADGDSDGDGLTDREEYLADTDPLDPDSYLRVTAIRPLGSGTIRVAWASRPTRLYRIECSTNAADPHGWQDCGYGPQQTTGSLSVRYLPLGTARLLLYRLRAVLPLEASPSPQ